MDVEIKILVAGQPEGGFFCDLKKAYNRFRFYYAPNVNSALSKAVGIKPQVVISEMLVGHSDAIDLCLSLKNSKELSNSIYCVLTELQDDYAEIAALNAGVDAFVRKPISPRVFAKKLTALLRRIPESREDGDIIKLRSADVHIKEHSVVLNDKPIDIPRIEFSILKLLALNKGAVFSREQIKKNVWGDDSGVNIRTIDVHIQNIRKKTDSCIIETVKGAGYKVQ